MTDIVAKMAEYKEYFERELENMLDNLACSGAPQPILSAVRYSIENGGKRIRPILVFFGAEFEGKSKEDVLNLALGIECIHSYSLVHDDLPCMDDDTLRRGQPTTHVRFGEGMAVLTGDALLNLGYEIALKKDNFGSRDARALSHFAKMAGILGMVGGQCIDISDNSKADMTLDDLLHLYRLKTSCLISSALVSGAIACGANEEDIANLSSYADKVGIIFQIVDDILDVTSSEAELGKNIGSDSDNGKMTSLKYMSIDEARSLIDTMRRDIVDTLAVYGDRASDLLALSDILINRTK